MKKKICNAIAHIQQSVEIFKKNLIMIDMLSIQQVTFKKN